MKYHVLPTNDLKEHTESEKCECNPTIKTVDKSMIIVHNSFDGRENIEKEITKYVNKIKRKTK